MRRDSGPAIPRAAFRRCVTASVVLALAADHVVRDTDALSLLPSGLVAAERAHRDLRRQPERAATNTLYQPATSFPAGPFGCEVR